MTGTHKELERIIQDVLMRDPNTTIFLESAVQKAEWQQMNEKLKKVSSMQKIV